MTPREGLLLLWEPNPAPWRWERAETQHPHRPRSGSGNVSGSDSRSQGRVWAPGGPRPTPDPVVSGWAPVHASLPQAQLQPARPRLEPQEGLTGEAS